MSKPYTEQHLSEQFDADLIWRRRELSDLKVAIRNADAVAKSVLLRSLITMTYAHWEGYVRFCANRYFEHLTLKKKYFSEFERQVYVNSFLRRVDALFRSGSSLESRCKLVNDILDGRNQRFAFVHSALIDTKSNLSANVVKDICVMCSVDASYFEQKEIFIDVIVLKRRNAIAHGQQEFISESEIDDLVADMLALMNHFRTLLENKVYAKTYLSASIA
jgi:MAE_28990/MAE_18760-like HEPN